MRLRGTTRWGVGLAAIATLVVLSAAAGGAGAVSTPAGGNVVGAGPSIGATPDGVPPQGADATITPGNTYFVGQTLYTGAFEADDDVDLVYANGTFVTEVQVRPDGGVYLRTERLSPGQYTLADDDGNEVDFGLADQTYEVGIADPVRPNGGPNASTWVTVSSNRDGYTHVVSSPTLSATELDGVFDEGEVADGDGDGDEELVIDGGTTAQSFAVDFTGVPPGNHTVRFEVPDTGVARTVRVRVRLYPTGKANVSHNRTPIRIQQSTGQRIEGTSTLPDGTRLEISVRNVGGQQFRRTRSVLVEDGAFEAQFDFSDVPVGQVFEVVVNQSSVVRDRVRGVVVRRASITAGDQTVEGDAITVGEVYLPNGGFVVARDAEGNRLGVSDYLDPGAHRRVPVPVDRPMSEGELDVVLGIYRDTDDDRRFAFSPGLNQDTPYRVGGTEVSTSIAVTVREGTPTATTTVSPTETVTETATATATATETATATATETAIATATETATATATETATATAVRTRSSTPATTSGGATGTDTTAGGGDGASGDEEPTRGGGAPGFGAAVAVLAVLAAALLAARRR